MKRVIFFVLAVGVCLAFGAHGSILFARNGEIEYSKEEFVRWASHYRSIVEATDPAHALTALKTDMDHDAEILRACHALVHEIGHAALLKYKTITDALSYEDETCGSGYLHGVIEERMVASTHILLDLKTICPTRDGKCYHGVGHGLMYFTNNNLPKSLTYCSTYKAQEARQRCSEGVFMENFTSDEHFHPSEYRNESDLFAICKKQKKEYRHVCYFYAPRYGIRHLPNGIAPLSLCAKAEVAFRSVCENGVGSAVMKNSLHDPAHARKLCGNNSNCIDGMVSYYIVHFDSLKKGSALCPLFEKETRVCLRAVAKRKTYYLN